MDDKAHVGFVDTHSKGNGCHDDVDALHQEVILRLRTQRGFKTSMIGCCLDVVGTQNLGKFLHLLA